MSLAAYANLKRLWWSLMVQLSSLTLYISLVFLKSIYVFALVNLSLWELLMFVKLVLHVRALYCVDLGLVLRSEHSGRGNEVASFHEKRHRHLNVCCQDQGFENVADSILNAIVFPA